MSVEDSVTFGGGGVGVGFASVARENSTLLSLRSPVRCVAYTSPLACCGSTGKDSPQRVQRTFKDAPPGVQ